MSYPYDQIENIKDLYVKNKITYEEAYRRLIGLGVRNAAIWLSSLTIRKG